MIDIDIPGLGALRLDHLVLDFNGTLALDGTIVDGVRERLIELARRLRLHVITGDTFGLARQELAGLPCELTVLGALAQGMAKRDHVIALGPEHTACIGNGRNDASMMKIAALGIAVVQAEGASPQTLRAADVVARDIRDALDLLAHPRRLTATLRT